MRQEMQNLERTLRSIIFFVQTKNIQTGSEARANVEDFLNRLEVGDVNEMDEVTLRGLKRDVNKLVHPDLIPENLHKEALGLVQKFNSKLDDIKKMQGEVKAEVEEPVAAQPEEPDRTGPFRGEEEPYSDPRQWRNKTEDPIAGVNSDEPTLFESLKLWVKYFLYKVPRNERDYEKIKKRYNLLIEELGYNLKFFKNEMDRLRRQLDSLDRQYEIDTKEENVEAARIAKVDKLNADVKKSEEAITELQQVSQARYDAVRQSKSGEIDAKFQNVIGPIMNNLSIFYQIANMPSSKLMAIYPGTDKTYFQVKEEIEAAMNVQFPYMKWASYPPTMIEETVRSQVANEIVNKNRAVRRFGRKLVKAHTNCNELVRMARKYSDPVAGSELVREELYADYSNDRKALQHELDQRRRQHDSTIWNLNRQKNNFAEFMNTYSSIYDARTEGQMETGRSATR